MIKRIHTIYNANEIISNTEIEYPRTTVYSLLTEAVDVVVYCGFRPDDHRLVG